MSELSTAFLPRCRYLILARQAGSYPEILGAVLSNISHTSREIQAASHEANTALLGLPPVEQGGAQVDTGAILNTISRELRSEQEPTRWVKGVVEACRLVLQGSRVGVCDVS